MKCPGASTRPPLSVLLRVCARLVPTSLVAAPTSRSSSQCRQRHGPDSRDPRLVPQTYTPRHLAKKILTSKAALEGERKHMTVLFADLKETMELLADRDRGGASLPRSVSSGDGAGHRYKGPSTRSWATDHGLFLDARQKVTT